MAVALYGALAYYSPWPWFSLLACVAAPLLLLRSEVSVRRGKAMLWRYMRRGRALRNVDALVVGAVTALFSYWVSDALATQWLVPNSGLALLGLSALIAALVVVGSIAIAFVFACSVAGAAAFAGEPESMAAIAGANTVLVVTSEGVASEVTGADALSGSTTVYVVGEGVDAVVSAGAIAGALAVAIAILSVGPSVLSIAGGLAGVLAGLLVAIWCSLVTTLAHAVLRVGRRQVQTVEPLGATRRAALLVPAIVLVPAVGLGVFARITCIRVLATLRHLSSGLSAFSRNWQETVLVVDSWHLPSFLPGAEQVNPLFDSRYLMKQANEHWVGTMFKYLLLGMICLPAVLYRWNIKASAWLWGPFALALRPVAWANEESMRETMSRQTTWPLLGLLFAVALGLGTWLLRPWFDLGLLREVPEWLNKLAEYMPAPALNLRTALLTLTLVGWIYFLWSSYCLRAAHDGPLGNAHDYEELTDSVKDRFRNLAKPVRTSSQWTAALGFLTVWMYALKWALSRWPDVLQGMVWNWLKTWL